MRVLVACEYSGAVRDALNRLGHDATSCDILPTEQGGPHIQGDVLNLLDAGWDMMIAFPPCTHLCSSGAREGEQVNEDQLRILELTTALAVCVGALQVISGVNGGTISAEGLKNILAIGYEALAKGGGT